MRPVLGIQGGDIRDEQGIEASRAGDDLTDSSYLGSPSPLWSLVAGHHWNAKTPLGGLPSDDTPNEFYELPQSLPSSLVQVCILCEHTFWGVGGAETGEETQGEKEETPSSWGSSAYRTGGDKYESFSLIIVCSAQTCYFFFFF